MQTFLGQYFLVEFYLLSVLFYQIVTGQIPLKEDESYDHDSTDASKLTFVINVCLQVPFNVFW